MTAPLPPRTARELAGPYYWSGPEGLACISEGLCPVDLARLIPRAGMGICPVCAMGYWIRGDDGSARAGCTQTHLQVQPDPLAGAQLAYTDYRVVSDPADPHGRRRPIPPVIRPR